MFVSASKSRSIFSNLKQLISFCKYSTTLNPRVRLCEVPGVCSSEEWYSVVRESSVALQNIVSRNHIQRDDVNTLPIETVIRKLQQSSHNNNNYLIETFR
ncbi:uncharacterized protein CDAR_62251 [Caerostris darwini]|uniref:Uncharacterized protein n=1 Tax=Caerostris darwini TaxID=1538125 RepID=A0AAV4UPX3_9ARAC|nr:uncharacterized protein CDAR_62251 [Caerostris darwini]